MLHLNEGHSAFATLEMIRSMMETSGLPFGEVVRDVSAMTVFTTHTPVAAGHDRFPAPLVEEHLGKIREALHLSYDDFMGLGRVYPGDPNEPFCMTVLALKLSRYANGVSALHGTVSRRMWQPLFVNTAEENVPIGHITNGVHVQSWVAPQMHLLFDRHLGTDWPKHQRHPETWVGIEHGRGRRALGDAAGAQGPADQLRPEPPGRRRPGAATSPTPPSSGPCRPST